MLKIVGAIAIFLLSLSISYAQQPSISGIDIKSGTPNTVLTISGSNFGTDINLVKVNFGSAFAEVISVNNSTLIVKVPPGSTYGPITVENLQSGLSAKSKEPFLMSFGGDKYDNTIVPGSDVFPAGNGLVEHCLCDFNNDGFVDIATANNNSQDISLFKNISTLNKVSFSKSNILVNGSTLSVACEDLDGDGKKDLVASKTSSGLSYQIFVLRNNSSATAISFDGYSTLTADGAIITKVLIEDLDKDGKPEIIASSQGKNTISVFKNTSTPGNLNFVLNVIPVAGTNGTTSLAVKDLNGDSYPEIVATGSFLGQQIFILGNQSTPGTISFQAAQTIEVTSGVNNLLIGDITADGKEDVLISNFNQDATKDDLAILENTTADNSFTFTFANEFFVNAHNKAWGIDLGDIDGNGKLDIVVASTDDTKRITILANTSDNTTLSFDKIYVNANEKSKSIKLGDLNNDGKPDVSYAGTDNSNLIINQNLNCIAPIITANFPFVICKNSGLELKVPMGIGVSYEWSIDDVVQPAAITNTLIASQSGVYKVRIKDASNLCDKTSTGTTITVIDPNSAVSQIEILADKDQFCSGDSVRLEVNGNFLDYSWSNGETTKFIYAKTGEEYLATVTVNGGCKTFGKITIPELPTPSLTVTAEATSVRKGLSTQLTASGGTTYTWTPTEGLSDPTIANPIATPAQTTTYKVEASNESGCIASAEIVIAVEATSLNITPRKVFTPNFDGIQDTWIIENIETYPDCEVIIFSRSGEKVFQAKPYANDWNGTLNGKALPAGDYYYIVESIETKAQKRGGLRIIR